MQELMASESLRFSDRSPVSEGAIRAHLRFVAEALAASAAPGTLEGLSAFAADFDTRVDAERDRLEAEFDAVAEQVGMETTLQFGEAAGEDPLTRKVVERRMLVNAWHRYFLFLLDDAAGASFASGVTVWMAENQARLGDLIFGTDRAAKAAIVAREGSDFLLDHERTNLVGQAAMLQAHTRFLVEAIGASRG